jgi:hypothetical protein
MATAERERVAALFWTGDGAEPATLAVSSELATRWQEALEPAAR